MPWRSQGDFGSEKEWLRYRLGRLRVFRVSVGDRQAEDALDIMIDETEARLRKIERAEG